MTFQGHMGDRWYFGITFGKWILLTVWTHPFRIQGPARTFATRD